MMSAPWLIRPDIYPFRSRFRLTPPFADETMCPGGEIMRPILSCLAAVIVLERRIATGLCLLAILLGGGGKGFATTIFDNEGSPDGNGFVVGLNPGTSDYYSIGFNFTVPIAGPSVVTGGSFAGLVFSGTPNPLELQIAPAVGADGLPGSPVVSTTLNLPSSAAYVGFTTTPTELTPGGTYWLIASVTDPTTSNSLWALTDAPPGFVFGDVATQSIDGGPYTLIDSDEVGMFSIDATTTPLPSTWAMMLTSLAGLGFVAYCGRRKVSAAVIAA